MTSWKAVQPLPIPLLPCSSCATLAHLGPPSLMWRHQPRFYFSLAPSPLPSSGSASVSFSPRHLCYTGIFIAFGKTGRDFASFLLFLSNLPSLCPISICLSFCFQRERDRNNLITARCYVTRKNICIVYSYIVYCDDFFYVSIIGSLFRLRLFSLFPKRFISKLHLFHFLNEDKNDRAECVE